MKNRVKRFYKELNEKVKNLPFNKETCTTLGGHNYSEYEGLFDLNYYDYTFTIVCDENGKCAVNENGIEVYDEEGMFVMVINLTD